MRRQFLRNLGGDALDDLGVERLAKIAQYFWRRDDDKLLETIGVSMTIERLGKLAGKPLLGDVVPVGFVHGAAGNPDACGGSPRTIGTLLARRRIVPLENSLNDKPDALRIALVTQEKRLLTVADQNESIMGDGRLGFRGHSTMLQIGCFN